MIIPESESLYKLDLNKNLQEPTGTFWYGENSNKGLGVFTYNGAKVNPIEGHNSDYRLIVPLEVETAFCNFILLAVWCKTHKSRDTYREQIWGAVNYYRDLISNEKVIIMGDFNSNSTWDRRRRQANHSNLVEYLKEINIESTYHLSHGQKQGQEKDPTFYQFKKMDRSYHIDYCFASKYFTDRLAMVEIGTYYDWIEHSDHSPIIVDFSFNQ